MLYPETIEQKIAFDRVRALLQAQCLSVLGREKVDAMQFSAEHADIVQRLAQTDEMRRLLTDETDEFPFSHVYDLREGLARIRIEGLYLDVDEVFDLRRSLETLNLTLQYIESREKNVYPELKLLISNTLSFPFVVVKIDAILDKFGKMRDNASPDLSRIRRELTQVQGSISRSLQSILRQAQADGLVEKDAQATMREGRLVIPVPPAYKRRLRGIVHDESASGKTVFIEPAEVVESNNRLRELEAEERREIIRILVDFANLLRPHLEDIFAAYDLLATIDFIRAKAFFALKINAIKPKINDSPHAEWQQARHPLLELSLKKQGKSIVPLDILLNEGQRILLISGPNAGGKSVCLKTVGLLQYMLQCGLLVPVHSGSLMGIFSRIFIDIGDEQSIENDLSTYSSHLTNMKFFARNSRHDTLLLIDEFGGGTEPQIGGAIAEALLASFNDSSTWGVITTHYTNLKHFAEDAAGIVNGAMLYDRHRMQPLFRLETGNPGSSFAVEIARKIGLPETVIQSAIDKVGAEHIDYDKHLQDIVRDKRYWEEKRRQIRQQEKRIEELQQKLADELQQTNAQRKEILRQAKQEAVALLANSNSKIENTIREIKEAQAEKEKTRAARKELEAFKEAVNEKNIEKQPSKLYTLNSKLSVGDAVRLKGQTAIGEVLDLQGKTAQVRFGTLKSTVKTADLERISRNEAKRESRQSTTVSNSTTDEIRRRKLHFRQEIDLRGMRADEALQAVTYFIDDALVVGVANVRILHGTGTGALRQLVRQYLGTVYGVAHFHDEHVQLGGAGITVVEFE